MRKKAAKATHLRRTTRENERHFHCGGHRARGIPWTDDPDQATCARCLAVHRDADRAATAERVRATRAAAGDPDARVLRTLPMVAAALEIRGRVVSLSATVSPTNGALTISTGEGNEPGLNIKVQNVAPGVIAHLLRAAATSIEESVGNNTTNGATRARKGK